MLLRVVSYCETGLEVKVLFCCPTIDKLRATRRQNLVLYPLRLCVLASLRLSPRLCKMQPPQNLGRAFCNNPVVRRSPGT